MTKPAFIITLDTEGDNLWENERDITTQNTHFLPRFQQLCRRFNFKPVWLTNYEMVMDEVYIELLVMLLHVIPVKLVCTCMHGITHH